MSDEEEIRALIRGHFEPMRWDAESEPDWETFRRDFHSGAVLCIARGHEPADDGSSRFVLRGPLGLLIDFVGERISEGIQSGCPGQYQ